MVVQEDNQSLYIWYNTTFSRISVLVLVFHYFYVSVVLDGVVKP